MDKSPAEGSTGEQPSEPTAEVLITAAKRGCTRSLGELAERYRRYLLHVANESLSPALRAKVGASDLVQETLFHAQARFERFAGTSEQEFLIWLRRILYFQALQVARRFEGTVSRDVRRELAISELADLAQQVALVDHFPTPSAALVAEERLLQVEAALAALPHDARKVIELRNVERKSFREIGSVLGCSPDAARKRWVRALAQMRTALTGHE